MQRSAGVRKTVEMEQLSDQEWQARMVEDALVPQRHMLSKSKGIKDVIGVFRLPVLCGLVVPTKRTWFSKVMVTCQRCLELRGD